MSNITRKSRDLLSMPNEILAEICGRIQALDWGDKGQHPLKSLRLTCKRLNVPAMKELAKRFLTNPHIMVNNYGLQTLVEICAHPLIGRYVRGITLDAFRLNQAYFDSGQARLNQYIASKDAQKVKEQLDSLNGFLEAVKEETLLDDGGRAVDLLAKAIGHIQVHHKSVGLALAAELDRSPIGGAKGLGKLPDDYSRSWSCAASVLKVRSTLRMLLDAAQRSACRVDDFLFHACDDEGYGEFESDVDLETAADVETLAGLKSIRLEIKSYGSRNLWIFAEILRMARRTSSLELTATVFMDVEVILEPMLSSENIELVFKSVSSDALREIDLSTLMCEQNVLRDFLDEHKFTIRELALTEVVMVGSWDEMLEWIGKNLGLQRLELKTLRTMDMQIYNNSRVDQYASDWVCHEVLQGEDEVRLGLVEVLEKKRKAEKERLHSEEEVNEIHEVGEAEEETSV